MKVIINGVESEIKSKNLYDLITEKGLEHNSVVIEMNQVIVKAINWKDTQIKDKDSIEILNFVGGG